MQNTLGEGLFLEPSILISLASDRLKNSNPDELERIELAIFKKVPQELYILKSVDEHKRLIGMKIILATLMKNYNEKTSYEIVNLFAEALGFKTLTPPSVSTNPIVIQNHSPQTQQQSSHQISKSVNRGITVALNINSIYNFAGRNWCVLDVKNDKALIISEEIIERKAYHSARGNITWEQCELRRYLNRAFYNSLGQEKSRIVEVRIENKNNPWYGTKGGNDTHDKIFLLSLDEVCRYFGDSTANLRKKGSTGSNLYINDNNNTARIAKDSSGKASWWWLRSPGSSSNLAANVGRDGYLDVEGHYIYSSGLGGGLRPALWLNL